MTRYLKYGAVALALLAATTGSAAAMEPPDEATATALQDPAELTARLSFAREIGNHEVDAFVLKRAITGLQRELLQAQGISAEALDAMAPMAEAPPPGRRGMPSQGNVKVLAILIEFNDFLHTNSATTVDSNLFGAGDPMRAPYESAAIYYDRASYGQLDLSQGTTLGWYKTAYDRSAVVQSTAGRETLIKEVLSHYDAQGHDFSQYDNDGNGAVDYLVVIWTGPDTGWGNFWWGYQTSFSDASYQLDGVRLGKYSWQWEARPVGTTFNPKVVIHETGHALGIPDFYDYDDSVGPRGGVGGLDIMHGNKGDHSCFSKWVLEWLTPTVVSTGSQSLSPKASGTSKDCVAIWPGLGTGNPFGEFFLAQNRHRVANDDAAGMPGDGMIIWHVDATLNAAGTNFLYNNSYTARKLLRLMEADGLEEIEAGGAADAGDYYKSGTLFSSCTAPSSQKYDGTDSGVEVSAISAVGPQMTASFAVGAQGLPDYTIDAIATNKASVVRGDDVNVTYTAKNIGGNPTMCINMAILLSDDATLTPTDTVLKSWGLPNCDIDACDDFTQTWTVTVPATTVPGSYYLGVYADVNSYQSEVDETNNAAAKPLLVSQGGGDGRWLKSYNAATINTAELELLRRYRDTFLAADASGQRYVRLLYDNSTEVLGVLLRNPELLAMLGDLVHANVDAVAAVLAGQRGELSDVRSIAAFLDTFAGRSGGIPQALALRVKRDLLGAADRGELFLGFTMGR